MLAEIAIAIVAQEARVGSGNLVKTVGSRNQVPSGVLSASWPDIASRAEVRRTGEAGEEDGDGQVRTSASRCLRRRGTLSTRFLTPVRTRSALVSLAVSHVLSSVPFPGLLRVRNPQQPRCVSAISSISSRC